MPSSTDDEDAQQQQQSGCKRPHASSELWEFESLIAAEPPKSKVVLGVDGGGTCTVCVCVAAPVVVPRDGSLPLLSRCVTASSNHNSVGGKLFTHSLLCSFVPLLLLLLLFCFPPPPLCCCFSFLSWIHHIPWNWILSRQRGESFSTSYTFPSVEFCLFIVSFCDMNVWNHVQTPNIPSANHFHCY